MRSFSDDDFNKEQTGLWFKVFNMNERVLSKLCTRIELYNYLLLL